MSELIERIARAISEACAGEFPGLWREDAARAAIAAMRDPTEAMVCEGARTIVEVTDRPRDFHPAKVAWQAMIDEALT